MLTQGVIARVWCYQETSSTRRFRMLWDWTCSARVVQPRVGNRWKKQTAEITAAAGAFHHSVARSSLSAPPWMFHHLCVPKMAP